MRAGVRAGLAGADYATIIAMVVKIPESLLQDDPKPLMWYDQAVTRTGGMG